MFRFAAINRTLLAACAPSFAGSVSRVSAANPAHVCSSNLVFIAGYASDLVDQQLTSRWEVPAGSDLRVSARSPADVHVVFGEPDAISVQVGKENPDQSIRL